MVTLIQFVSTSEGINIFEPHTGVWCCPVIPVSSEFQMGCIFRHSKNKDNEQYFWYGSSKESHAQ